MSDEVRPIRKKILWVGHRSPLWPHLEDAFDIRFGEEACRVVQATTGEFRSFDLPRLLRLCEAQHFAPDLVLFWEPSIKIGYEGLENLKARTAAYIADSHCSFPWASEMAPLFDSVLLDIRECFRFFWRTTQDRLAWLPLYCPGPPP